MCTRVCIGRLVYNVQNWMLIRHPAFSFLCNSICTFQNPHFFFLTYYYWSFSLFFKSRVRMQTAEVQEGKKKTPQNHWSWQCYETNRKAAKQLPKNQWEEREGKIPHGTAYLRAHLSLLASPFFRCLEDRQVYYCILKLIRKALYAKIYWLIIIERWKFMLQAAAFMLKAYACYL